MSITSKRIMRLFGKVVNRLIPKHKDWIYVEPHINGKTDKFDLINCNADNSLKTINYFINNYQGRICRLYIEVYDKDRMPELERYVKTVGNRDIEVVFLESCWDQKGKKITFDVLVRFIRNHLIRYSCHVWCADTGWAHFFDKVKPQKLISFNYGVPFKRGGVYSKYFTFEHFDYICETSMMCSKIIAAEYLGNYDSFVDIGFARNDTIGYSDKRDVVNAWLKSIGCEDKKIIVYVPTYRPNPIDYSENNIFGFKDNGELDEILERNNAIIIAKVHPVQRKWMTNLPSNVISFEPSYDFTIYDVFNMTNVLISDYSSISTDFILAHKPIIYLFSDFDEYADSRGYSFEPIQDVCCGDVVYSWDEMKESLEKNLNNEIVRDELYEMKKRLWFKYDDFKSTERNYNLLKQVMEL